MIRVCLVEDQTLVREGIRSLLALSSEIKIVGEAAMVTKRYKSLPALDLMSSCSI